MLAHACCAARPEGPLSELLLLKPLVCAGGCRGTGGMGAHAGGRKPGVHAPEGGEAEVLGVGMRAVHACHMSHCNTHMICVLQVQCCRCSVGWKTGSGCWIRGAGRAAQIRKRSSTDKGNRIEAWLAA